MGSGMGIISEHLMRKNLMLKSEIFELEHEAEEQ
jgi:hypothetical protein